VVLARSQTEPGGGDKEHVPDYQQIGRLKHTPGSGILSLKCSSDGPTRVLTITDENKKVGVYFNKHIVYDCGLCCCSTLILVLVMIGWWWKMESLLQQSHHQLINS